MTLNTSWWRYEVVLGSDTIVCPCKGSDTRGADHQPRARIDVAGLLGRFFRLFQAC
jgi:hypothetical protein